MHLRSDSFNTQLFIQEAVNQENSYTDKKGQGEEDSE